AFVFVVKRALELVRAQHVTLFDTAIHQAALECAGEEVWSMLWLPRATERLASAAPSDPLAAALAAFQSATTDVEPPLTPRARGDISRGQNVAGVGRAAEIFRTLARMYGSGAR